jgi:hypothetical protein
MILLDGDCTLKTASRLDALSLNKYQKIHADNSISKLEELVAYGESVLAKAKEAFGAKQFAFAQSTLHA